MARRKKGAVPPQLRPYLFRKGGGSVRRRIRHAYRGLRRAVAKHPGKISVLTASTIAAIVFQLTGWAQRQREEFYRAVQNLLSQFGIKMTVNGMTLYSALLILEGLCVLMPSLIGRKVDALLARFNLRR